ncbi:MAG: class I SAM-dependent methyltransferase [bacterium]
MMETPDVPRVTRANYGIDAPGVIRTMALLAMALIGGGLVLQAISPAGSAGARWGVAMRWPGASFAITALLMLASSRYGKQRARDRLLDRLALRGDETVLDVGCGHGLMLIGAAKRVPRGSAIGVDLWSQADQYANSAAATLANAEAEGVGERVTVRDGDMRALILDDASVDIVVSSLAIHNVPTTQERGRAIREIARVVRPGGRVAILDIAHVGDYARELRTLGWTIEGNGITPWIFPPTRELVARKPSELSA